MKPPSDTSQSKLNLTTQGSRQLKQLELKLKQTKLEHRLHITALKQENLKCHKQVAKLLAKNSSLLNEIKVFRKEYSKYQHDNPPIGKLTVEQQEELELLAGLRADHEIALLQLQKKDEKHETT